VFNKNLLANRIRKGELVLVNKAFLLLNPVMKVYCFNICFYESIYSVAPDTYNIVQPDSPLLIKKKK